MSGAWEGGKGSRPRKYNVSKYLDNYDRIFGNAKEQKEGKERDQREHQDRDAIGQTQGPGDSHSDVQG